jgi:hypothetical protein
MRNRGWSELSGCQRAGVIVMATLQLALLVAALWDLAHRKPDEVRGDRPMWAGIAFINWIGPMAYFCFGRRTQQFSSVSRKASRVYGFFTEAVKP